MNLKTIILTLLVLSAVLAAGCTSNDGNNWKDYNFSVDFNDNNSNSSLNVSENLSSDKGNSVVNEKKEDKNKIDETKASFTINGVEGDLIKIPVSAVDPDGDFLNYKFSKPFNEDGLWQTKIGDAGKYLVKVTVDDGTLSTSEFVLVNIARANRPPTIECSDKITVSEGETVKLDCNIFDVDGDVVIVGYDGWMKTSTYKTTFGDAGIHTVVVRAKDKDHESFKEIKINVKKTNRAPVIEEMDPQEVMEGETITIKPVVSDPDGDSLTVTFSKPLNENGSWTPTFGDRGTYEITVSVTDGIDTTKQTFKLKVLKLNRAPVIKPIDTIRVKEGEMVEIPVKVFDPDGDDVVISYSGWMDSDKYQTTYTDAYPDGCDKKGCVAVYTVKVSASDGILSDSQNVKVEVLDVNRPPKFIFGNNN